MNSEERFRFEEVSCRGADWERFLPGIYELDSRFYRAVVGNEGDQTRILPAIQSGARVYSLALLGDLPAGFRRLDFLPDKVEFGAVYVAPAFRDKPLTLLRPLVKHAYFFACERGYSNEQMHLYRHNEYGESLWNSERSAWDRWRREFDSTLAST